MAHGKRVGSAIVGLALATFEQFWIANTLFAAFVLAGLVGSAVKIVAYRRGSNPFEYKNTNGFMITVDVASSDVPAAPAGTK